MVSTPVTKGHRASLKLLQNVDGVRETLEMYEEAISGDGVYLRPTDAGLTVLVLDARAPKFISAGSIKTTPPTTDRVAKGAAKYRGDLEGSKKPEEKFSLKLLRSAFANGLRLPDSDLCFFSHEWRFVLGKSFGKSDLLAVDMNDGRLVVVELKYGKPLESGFAQAKDYIGCLKQSPKLLEFFADLFEAMKAIYAPVGVFDGVCVDQNLSPRAEVWSPEGRIPVPLAESPGDVS